MHVTADQLVVELKSQPGYSDGTGEVVVTDLTNYAMPFVRYANGDLATPEVGAGCACGRGLPRLRRVEGRKLDAIRTPDGHVVPGEFFPHMLKDVAGLQRYRVIQRQLDALQIDVVPEPPFGEEQEAYIRREVAKVFGDTISVELRRVADIPLTPTGKSRVTISELS
jgi:phenylacetate-CoA ligase